MEINSSQATARALYEGTFSVGLDKKFNRINREDPPAKGALKISINPFLIKTPERNYLFDVGIGDFGEDTSTETIKTNLAQHGLTEYDITDIFISHLHFDHIGGLAGKSSGYWELTFPDARVWASKREWNKIQEMEDYSDAERAEFVSFLDARADLHFFEEADRPYPDIEARHMGGHTEFSYLLLFENETQKYLMAGDVLALRDEVNRKFAAKYDYDPEESMNIRRELTHKAHQEGFTVMGYHDSHHPLFDLTDYDENQGFTIKKAEEHVSS